MIKSINWMVIFLSLTLHVNVSAQQDGLPFLKPSINMSAKDSLLMNLQEDLGVMLSERNKEIVFNNVFKSYMNTKFDIEKVFGNDFLESAKFKNDKNGYVEYLLSYDQRTVGITLKHYKDVKQLVVGLREMLAVNSSEVKTIYENYQKENNLELSYEKNSYALFKRIDHSDFKLIHSNGEQSLLLFQTFYILDLE